MKWELQADRSTSILPYHPRSLALYLLILLLVGLLLDSWPILLLMLVGLCLLNLRYGKPSALKRVFVYAGPMVLLIVLFNVLLNQNGQDALISFSIPVLGTLTLYEESLLFALGMGLKLLVVLAIFLLMESLLPPERMLDVFGPKGGQAALLIIMTLRLLPRLAERGQEIRQVQMYRGLAVAGSGVRERVISLRPFLLNILRAALDESLVIAQIMQARAYGSGPRSHYYQAEWQACDWFLSIWATAMFLICLYLAYQPAYDLIAWISAIITAALLLPLLLRREEAYGAY